MVLLKTYVESRSVVKNQEIQVLGGQRLIVSS